MKIQKAAVIGHPIGHTMSPFIHRRLFQLEGIPFTYEVLDVPDLEAAMPSLRQLDCFNITIPHKSAILPWLDELDGQARRFGSVNTVRRTGDVLKGYTTDGAGCRKALENHGLDFSGRVLLLGNGGAARALAFEAAQCQPHLDLTIACRKSSLEKAARLAREVENFLQNRGGGRLTLRTYEELERESALENTGTEYTLLLNATSVGMVPHAGNSPVSRSVVSRCKAVFDAVYNPARTELLRLAEECGAKTVGGMEMLVYQAVAAHEIWYGTRFRSSDLTELCGDAQEELARLFPENSTRKGGESQ